MCPAPSDPRCAVGIRPCPCQGQIYRCAGPGRWRPKVRRSRRSCARCPNPRSRWNPVQRPTRLKPKSSARSQGRWTRSGRCWWSLNRANNTFQTLNLTRWWPWHPKMPIGRSSHALSFPRLSQPTVKHPWTFLRPCRMQSHIRCKTRWLSRMKCRVSFWAGCFARFSTVQCPFPALRIRLAWTWPGMSRPWSTLCPAHLTFCQF